MFVGSLQALEVSWHLSTYPDTAIIMEDGCETSLVETTFIKPSETGSIKPFTVYQAHQSERLHSEDEFAFDGVKFSKVGHYDPNVSPLAM